MLRQALVVAPVFTYALFAGAGITVTNVARSVYAQACGTTNAGTFCDYDADSNYSTGYWTRDALTDYSGSSLFGSVHTTAQAAQHSTATYSTIETSMTMYNYITATADTFGSAETKNAYEVRFYTPSNVAMNLNTSVTGDGWSVIVSKFEGPAVYNSGLSASVTIPLEAGEWVMRIENGRGPACGPCFVSSSDTLTASVSFEFGPCEADFNGDHQVDDSDFSIFVVAYNELLCPNFPEPCTGDINKDGYVDDSDFSLFVVAYNELICP